MYSKRSFISTVIPIVHSIPSRNRSFSKTLFKAPEEFETAGFSVSCGRRKRCFSYRVFVKHKSKLIGDCCVFKLFRPSVDEKHLMRAKPAFFISSVFLVLWTEPSVDSVQGTSSRHFKLWFAGRSLQLPIITALVHASIDIPDFLTFVLIFILNLLLSFLFVFR